MSAVIKETIYQSKQNIEQQLESSFSAVAYLCAVSWNKPLTLDKLLFSQQCKIPNCKMLYVIDINGIQISANVFPKKINTDKRGQNLRDRPYIQEMDSSRPFQLSSVYISQTDYCPCITAIHEIKNKQDQRKGYLVADFDLSNLPDADINAGNTVPWRQIKGDPAIRGQLFQQYHVPSLMDQHLPQVHNIVANLICQRGIFHVKLHYSSSRATLWEFDRPHQYHLHVLEEIISPDVCLIYKKRIYPADAMILPSMVKKILNKFEMLRNADDTIYLRSASINIVNAMVGLTFSCDGSHYMLADEFLKKPNSFWFG